MASFPRRLSLAVLAASLLIIGGANAAAPKPVVDGKRIIDSSTGEQFIPHGVNFPGYEYACQQGWGYGNVGTEPENVSSTVAGIATWNINTVRLPLNQDCWLGEDGLPSGGLTVSGYRNSVEHFVDALNAAGMVAIVDLHWSGPDGVVADGLRPMPDDRSPTFWSSVASRFKDNPSVIFDLFNEPHSRWNAGVVNVFSLSWSCWANGGCQAPVEKDTDLVSGLGWYRTAGMKSLVARVRSAGATQPILLSGIDYANDLRGWLESAPADGQVIAGFHNYPGQRCRTNQCWNEEIAPLAEKVPVLAAEFGQNDCGSPTHMTRFMDWADDHRIGYLAWAWWNLPTLGCTNFALVSDLDGTPLAPAGTALHDHLENLPAVLPPRPTPINPRLLIRTAKWNSRKLLLRIEVSPQASKPVRASIRLARDRRVRKKPKSKVRLIRRQLKHVAGVSTMAFRVPRGLRPKMVTAYYPGDSLLRARTVSKRPSVSKVTRKRPRG